MERPLVSDATNPGSFMMDKSFACRENSSWGQAEGGPKDDAPSLLLSRSGPQVPRSSPRRLGDSEVLTRQTQSVQFSLGGENTSPSERRMPLCRQPGTDRQTEVSPKGKLEVV